MNLQKHLQPQPVRLGHQFSSPLYRHRRSYNEHGLEQLIFIYYEILAENGNIHQRTHPADEIETPSEIFAVGEHRQRRRSGGCISGHHLCRECIGVNPPLRGGFAFEFGDNTRLRCLESRAHRQPRARGKRLNLPVKQLIRESALCSLHLNPLVGENLL